MAWMQIDDEAYIEMKQELARLRAREQELLESNNRLVAERRDTLRARVRNWKASFGFSVHDVPCVPEPQRAVLAIGLIVEEFCEMLEALGFAPLVTKQIRDVYALGLPSAGPIDFPELADAWADLKFVIEGAEIDFGVNGDRVMDAVYAANMAKLGGPIREDGKRLKPPGWAPPDIAGVLRAQGWKGWKG